MNFIITIEKNNAFGYISEFSYGDAFRDGGL